MKRIKKQDIVFPSNWGKIKVSGKYVDFGEIPQAMAFTNIFDGRTRRGKPIKKIAKLLYYPLLVLSYASLASIIALFMILWLN